MRQQKDLIDALDPPASQSTQLSTALVISGQRLAPEQTLFNQLLAKIEKSKLALENYILWVAEHRAQHAKRRTPPEQQQQAWQKQMILFLDRRLQNIKGWSQAIPAYMVQVLRSLAGSLVYGPSGVGMTSIYQRHATESDLDGMADAIAAMQEMMANVFGVVMVADEKLDSPEYSKKSQPKKEAKTGASRA